MTKLKADVLRVAFRRLSLVSASEALDADQESYAGEILDGLFAELPTTQDMTFTWDLSTVPDGALLPLGYLLAVEIAPQYLVQPPEPYSRAMGRLRAYMFADDRDDPRDADGDGVISDAEESAGKRAAYY